MAVAITNVLSGGAVPTSGVNTTASWTPDTTAQTLLAISSYVSAGSAVPTITSVAGNGLTWTLIMGPVNGDNTGTDRTSLWVYAAVNTGGTAGTVAITYGTAPSKASWSLEKVAGADTGLGVGTLPQPAVSAVSSGANPTVNLGSAPAATSVTYAAADFESSAGTLTPGTGFTQLAQVVTQSLAWIITEFESPAVQNSITASNSTTSNRHSIIALEVAVAAAAAALPPELVMAPMTGA